MLSLTKVHPLPVLLIAAACIDALSSPPLSTTLGIGAVGQLVLSALFVIALIIWLVASGRAARNQKREQAASD